MKQIWKRSMSLLLSGVLLLSNVPLSALATEESPAPTETVVEEVQPVETELVQTQSVEIQPIENQSVETQPVVTVLEHTAEVANTGLESKLQITQNGNPVDDAWLGTNYDEEQNQLTLNAENLDSVSYTEASQSLKIVLEEGTTSTISGALIAQMGIQITGKGTLIVGSIDAGENLEIVDAVVKVGSDKQSEEETKNLIKVKNEIKVSGEAHLATANGHNAVVFTDDLENAVLKISGEGYYRTGADTAFAEIAAGTTLEKTLLYFEAAGNNHVSENFVGKDKDQHYKPCADEACPLREECEFGLANHGDETKFEPDSANVEVHNKVTICCGYILEKNLDHSNVTYSLSEDGMTITVVCSDCGQTGSATVVSGGGVENGTITPADVTQTGMLENEDIDLKFTAKNGAETTVAPEEWGEYVVSITVGDKTASAIRYITKDIAAEDFELDGQLTYNGQPQTQNVQYTGTETNVTFKVTDNVQTDAGNYTLKISGEGIYSGTATLAFAIKKAAPVVAVTNTQVVTKKTYDFKEPAFAGLDGQPLEGTPTYSYGSGSGLTYAQIKEELKKHFENNTTEVEIGYLFTPNSPNYDVAGSGDAPIKITAKEVRFARTDKTDLGKADVLSKDTWVYGENPVSVENINAFVDGTKTETDSGYTVTYYNTSNTAVETKPLPAGTYTFKITYSGTVDGVYCKDYAVFTGTEPVTVTKKKIAITTEYEVVHLTYDAENSQELLRGTPATDVTEEGAFEWKYRVNGVDVPGSGVPQRKDIAVYKVEYWADSKSDNYSDSEKVEEKVAILPELKAEYGKYLKDISLGSTGFAWDEVKNPAQTTPVGNVKDSAAERTYKLEYTRDPLLSDIPVVVTVLPKKITPSVVVKDADKYIHYEDRTKMTNFELWDEGANKKLTANDYSASIDTSTIQTGKRVYTFTKDQGGNYDFEPVTMDVMLYRPDHSALTDNNFPKDDLTGTSNDTLSKVKSALSAKIKADDYPESGMKYFSVYMTKKSGTSWVEHRADDAFPTDEAGIDYVIPYTDLGADKEDIFKISIMDTAGENAGKEAKEVTALKTDNGLKINLKEYAAVCVAVQVDLNAEYEIKKSIIYDGSSSNKGTLSFKLNGTSVTKAKCGDVIDVEATANSGYSISSVSCTAENSATTGFEKVSEGKYKFTMPASKVTVKLTLKKTTSNTKNPYSGDTSNIYLWLAILASSAVGIVALVIFWFKKRRK